MAAPALDLFPSTTLFPGTVQPIDTGGYISLAEMALGDLILTADDSVGVEWITTDLDGWMGSPGSSLQLVQRTRGPGAWTGPRNLEARTLAIKGSVFAPSTLALAQAVDRLNAAASLNATLFTLSEDSFARSCIVYRQDEVLVTRSGPTSANWSLQLTAPDPRKFTSAVTGSTALPSSSGGITVPFTVPFAINSTVVSGRVQLTNPGTASGPVVLRIDGPVTGPQVTHLGTGLQLTFGSSLQLNAGEYLIVDMEAQTSLANGQVSRNSSIVSRGWSGMEPGINTWAFAALAGSGLLTVTATPSWL